MNKNNNDPKPITQEKVSLLCETTKEALLSLSLIDSLSPYDNQRNSDYPDVLKHIVWVLHSHLAITVYKLYDPDSRNVNIKNLYTSIIKAQSTCIYPAQVLELLKRLNEVISNNKMWDKARIIRNEFWAHNTLIEEKEKTISDINNIRKNYLALTLFAYLVCKIYKVGEQSSQ